MRLKVKVNNSNYFNILLSLLKDIHPFSMLRNRELDALAEFLKYNELYRSIPKEDRMKIVFSYETRLKVAENIGSTRESLYNLVKKLRDSGIFEGNSISNTFDKTLTKYKELVFEFDYDGINNEEDHATEETM